LKTCNLNFNIIPEIKARFSLEDAIELVNINKLKQTGNRYSGLCPLPGHTEKTPSWIGWKDSQRWRCFGCNAFGDQIDLVAQVTGQSTHKTIKMLAAQLGLKQEASPQAMKAAREYQDKKNQDKQLDSELQQIIQNSRKACFYLEGWIETIKKTIHGESDLERPMVVWALQNAAFIHHFADVFLDGTDQEQLQNVLSFWRWRQSHDLLKHLNPWD